MEKRCQFVSEDDRGNFHRCENAATSHVHWSMNFCEEHEPQEGEQYSKKYEVSSYASILFHDTSIS